MHIFKLYDEKKFFEIEFDETIDENDMGFLKQIIESSFDMNKKVKLKKPEILENEVEINCYHTKELAELKIDAKDQKGLFAYIAFVLDEFSIDIESAKIYTNKGRARDLLLIAKNGHFCPNQEEVTKMLVLGKETERLRD